MEKKERCCGWLPFVYFAVFCVKCSHIYIAFKLHALLKVTEAKTDTSKSGFLHCGTINFLRQAILLCVGGNPVHCRMLSSIPGVHPLDATSILSVVTVKNISTTGK